jgi:hypothetical protein
MIIVRPTCPVLTVTCGLALAGDHAPETVAAHRVALADRHATDRATV